MVLPVVADWRAASRISGDEGVVLERRQSAPLFDPAGENGFHAMV